MSRQYFAPRSNLEISWHEMQTSVAALSQRAAVTVGREVTSSNAIGSTQLRWQESGTMHVIATTVNAFIEHQLTLYEQVSCSASAGSTLAMLSSS